MEILIDPQGRSIQISPFAETAMVCLRKMRPGATVKVTTEPADIFSGIHIVMQQGFKIWTFCFCLADKMDVPAWIAGSSASMCVVYSPVADELWAFPRMAFLNAIGEDWAVSDEWLSMNVRGATIIRNASNFHGVPEEPDVSKGFRSGRKRHATNRRA